MTPEEHLDIISSLGKRVFFFDDVPLSVIKEAILRGFECFLSKELRFLTNWEYLFCSSSQFLEWGDGFGHGISQGRGWKGSGAGELGPCDGWIVFHHTEERWDSWSFEWIFYYRNYYFNSLDRVGIDPYLPEGMCGKNRLEGFDWNEFPQ